MRHGAMSGGERGPGRRPVVVFLMGPTAAGKTEAAVALARALGTEVVSVDSAQVYRGMDIGTAKPPPALRAEVPHRLLDILEPEERYSAARFRADALAAIRELAGRGRVPVLAGGTMLYFRALEQGLAPLPEADPAVRAAIAAEAAERGWPALHAELARVDPAAAARIRPTDPQRIQRALEVWRLTGRPLSAWLAEARPEPPPFRAVRIVLAPAERAELHRRIAARLETMFAAGFVEEVARLRARPGLTRAHPSMRAVGYRQVWDHLEGRWDEDEMRARALYATRQLAKRQLTWLRRRWGPGVAEWVDAGRADAAARVRAAVERALEAARADGADA